MIDDRFKQVDIELDGTVYNRIKGFEHEYERILELANAVVPEGRYRSLAYTALEESAMWMNKAITHGR